MSLRPIPRPPTSWSKSAVRSLTVREYERKHHTRPRPEFLKTGDTIRILTGANATRKRNLTFRGVLTAFKEGMKTFATSVLFLKLGKQRRDRNATLNAGQRFDGAVNKLVEDLAEGKSMSGRTSGRPEIAHRTEQLFDQAKILKKRGGFSDEDIETRFRTNLMESLRVLKKEGNDGVYEAVLERLKTDVLPTLDKRAGSPEWDKVPEVEKKNQEYASIAERLDGAALIDSEEGKQRTDFNRSVVVALRDAVVWGGDPKGFDAFSGSRIQHGAFDGDPQMLQVFNKDPFAYGDFQGDAEAYEKWGGCRPLSDRFGGNAGELVGPKGAQVLANWLDHEYGKGAGEAFVKTFSYQDGVAVDGLKNLGINVQQTLEAYRYKNFNGLDVMKLSRNVDPLIEAGRSGSFDNSIRHLADAFQAYVKESKEGNERSLIWMYDYVNLQKDVPKLTKKKLVIAIKQLAEPLWPAKSGSQVGVSNDAKDDSKDDITSKDDQRYVESYVGAPDDFNIRSQAKARFQREIARQAGYSYHKMKPTIERSYKELEKLNEKQLVDVLTKGFNEAASNLRAVLRDAMTKFGNAFPEREKITNTISMYKHAINRNAPSRLDGKQFGEEMIQWRLSNKKKDKHRIDGRDLRHIEQEIESRQRQVEIEKEMEHRRKVHAEAGRAGKNGPDLKIIEKQRPESIDDGKDDIKKDV